MALTAPHPPLACSVRACGLPLQRLDRAFVCPRGHTHDVSRRGYVNLLQPQDRRSRAPGDDAEAVEARARLLAAGVGRPLIDALADRAAALLSGRAGVVVDLGSGGGETLEAIAGRCPIIGVGIDVSTAAAMRAARRQLPVTWVVANADRRLPVLAASVDVVVSVHARRNPAECARVLDPDGALLVAVPAPEDLMELRSLVLGADIPRDRSPAVLAEHDQWFVLRERGSVRQRVRLERAALLDLLRGTYRGRRGSAAARVDALTSIEVTLASDWFELVRRRTSRSAGSPDDDRRRDSRGKGPPLVGADRYEAMSTRRRGIAMPRILIL